MTGANLPACRRIHLRQGCGGQVGEKPKTENGRPKTVNGTLKGA